MTELDLPLRSPALYNPHLLSKEELVGLFSARQALLDELLEDLRSTPPGKSAQHHLIVGQRGMGKTMLLRRIQFAVEDDPELHMLWLALSFPEEQYNVASLSDFWLNCTDALSDTLERLGPSKTFGRAEEVVRTLDETVEALRNIPEEERSRRALEMLTDAASKLDRRFLLLVDNADLVLDRIDEQEWELREVLSSRPEVTFLGASSAAIESTYEYGKAFYDFYRIHDLSGLSIEETRTLLLQYAQAQGHEKVRRIVEEETGRLRTLHTLTGGNPRTLALLFNIFVQGPDGDVRSDLEQLLDQCTPLYKARFEELSPQAQQVVDALALHWDPVSAGELAEKLRLQVNAVSAQLNRLVQQGIVEKVPYEPASKTGFQVAERFFNIWYLMRASRRIRRRLIWLVEFFRMVYSQDELRTKAQSHLRRLGQLDPQHRLRHAEYSFALASAFEEGPLRGALERSALQVLVDHEDFRQDLRDLLKFDGSNHSLRTRAEYLERFKVLRASIDALMEEGVLSRQLAHQLLRAPLHLGEKEWILDELRKVGTEQLQEVAKAVSGLERSFLRAIRSEELGQQLLGATDAGRMISFDDIEGAKVVEATSEARGIVAVAAAARVHSAVDKEAFNDLEAALKDATISYPWLVWHRELGHGKPSEDIESVFNAAKKLVQDRKGALLFLGTYLALCLGGADDFEGAEAIAQKVLESAVDIPYLADISHVPKANIDRIVAVATGKSQVPVMSGRSWPEVLAFFREKVRMGQAREATELLDELERGERWRPLREALEVIALDNPRYLRRLAPEVREPTEAILEELTASREKTA